MLKERDAHDQGTRFLRCKKIATLAELVLHLHCSARTAQRRLAECKAMHSYNHNGRYYTLPQIPRFDPHGLWRHRGVFFSRYGNLPETFVQVVHQSPAGLTAAEAGDLLGLRPSSFLWSLRNHPGLKREKHQGLYVYLAGESQRCAEQQRQRARTPPALREPTAPEAIAILVEKIKHPTLTVTALCLRLREQGLHVDPDRIDAFFARHGLTVKKTPPLP
jgi:hypothetical protein